MGVVVSMLEGVVIGGAVGSYAGHAAGGILSMGNSVQREWITAGGFIGGATGGAAVGVMHQIHGDWNSMRHKELRNDGWSSANENSV